jgi:3-oxoadipate enol-lactonase
VRLHHRFDGPADAPVLVLSSSLGTTLELWDANVAALSERCRVLRYDHRGHGSSPVPPGPYSIEELGRDVVELLDELGLERVSFCGISLGGAVGLWLAASEPERLDRLVVACSSARFGPAESWLERARIVRAGGVTAISEAVVGRWFTPALASDDVALVARFRHMLEATPAEGYAACCDAIAGWSFEDRLGEVSAPALVVSAAQDPATPPEHGRTIAGGVPRARLAVVEGAAHLLNVERPDEFSQLVLGHVAAGTPVGEPA